MERFKRRPLAAAMLLAFSASAPEWALAQSQSEQTLPEVRVQGVQDAFKTESSSTATRTDTPLRDIPQTINIVPQSIIRSQGATTLQDALRNVPGITYGAAEGGDLSNQVFMIRGDISLGSLYVDGVRDIGEYNRDLFATESVEVLKGASGLMFGRGNPNGVINQVTKSADLTPRKEVGLMVGSFDTKRLTGDLNMPLDNGAAFRIVALAEKSGSYRYPQDVEKTGIAPSFRFGVGRDTDITLQYYYLKTTDVTDYGQPALINNAIGFYAFPPSARTYYGLANYDKTDHETNIATFKIEHRVNDSLTVRDTLRWANYKRTMQATIAAADTPGGGFSPATDLSTVTFNRQPTKARDNDDGGLINQLEAVWKVSTGSVKHTLLGGFELAQEELNRQNYVFGGTTKQTGQSWLSPDPYSVVNFTKTPGTNPVSEADSYAFYLQDQLELTPTWKAVLGARWENYDSSVTTFAANGTVATPEVSRTDKMLSTRAGLMWQPTNRQSYYVSYGNAYEPSGTLGVYGATGSDLTAESANLDPEETRVYEVGGQWEIMPALQLRAALFRSEKKNERVDTSPAAGNQFQLIGERELNGLEMDIAGRLSRNWDIYGAVSLTDGGEIVQGPTTGVSQNGQPLAVPKHAGNVWTIYRLGGGWEVGGGYFWSAERPVAMNGNGPTLPSWDRWDATIAYVQRKYEVRLNLNNITDELYYIAAYQNSGNRVVPATPRSAMLSARFNFD